MYQLIQKFITPNPWSRPQKSINKILGIAIHWVANPKSTAMQNRDYFESLKNGKNGYGSAHEIIDLNGDIIVCLPSSEIGYHVGSETYTDRCLKELGNSPNYCMYGIECCHLDWAGKMTDSTYNTLVERCADLCFNFGLDPLKNIWTHKMVVGWKDCHRWFVNNPKEWDLFLNKVNDLYKSKLRKDSTNMKTWQQEVGEKAIDSLAIKSDKDGNKLLNAPDVWKGKDLEKESVPLWLFFEMINRISK